MLTVVILDHPIFGQQRALRKMGLQQLQLMPGLHIPRPADSAPKALPSVPMTTKTMVKLSQQEVSKYFEKATQAMNLTSATPDFTNAFTISPTNPVVPGKGHILRIFGAKDILLYYYGSGVVIFDQPGDDNHFVEFVVGPAKKGLYLLNCNVGAGNIYQINNAQIQVGSQNLTVSGAADPQTGIIVFPVYVPQDSCNIRISFTGSVSVTSSNNSWQWGGCEVIPQS
jgi:hypothetical protein